MGILTQLLTDFSSVCANGISLIQGDAMSLLGKLVILDLLLAVLLNLDNQDHLKTLVEKTLKYGFFIWLVRDWRTILGWVLQGFVYVGLKAGGNTMSQQTFTDPSMIGEYGLYVTQPIYETIKNISPLNIGAILSHQLTTGFAGLIIIGAFFIIGIQIFITYIEFYVISTLALILIPFGSNKYTAFLGEKALGGVISFGIKLMVLAFIASVSIPLVQKWVLPEDPSFGECMRLALGSAALAALAWQAPSLAAGMLSGAPSLTAGVAGGMVGGAVGGALGAGAAVQASAQKMTAGYQAMQKAAASLGSGGGSGGSPGGGSLGTGSGGTGTASSSGSSEKPSAANMAQRLGSMDKT